MANHGVVSAPEAFDSLFRVGTRIGPFEIIGEVGRGETGVVYSARDTRLGRTVALKLLLPDLTSDPAAREQLVSEAKIASATDHPNIAAIYEMDETAEGHLYLAMACYEGETLKERLLRGPLGPAEAADVARQTAEGLEAAHRRGVAHRDVKPANIFLTADGLVKILEFGVPKRGRSEGSESAFAPGTVAYMSPEAVGQRRFDHRSDLWSLGIMLYEMLSGRHPFQRDDEAAVVRAILEEEPEPLESTGDPVPDRLARIVDRLLAKDPARRYETARQVSEDLEKWKVVVHPRGYRRGVLWVRRAGLTIAAAVLLVLAPTDRSGDGTVGAASRIAVFPFHVQGAGQYAYLREGVAELLSASLDGTDDLQAVSQRMILRQFEREGRDDLALGDAVRLATVLEADRFILGRIIELGEGLRVQADLYERIHPAAPVAQATVEGSADRLFNLADELTAQLLVVAHPESHPLTRVAAVTTTSLEAFKAYLEGERALRERRFADAIEALQHAVRVDSTFALANYRLSWAASWERRYDVARQAAESAGRHSGRLPREARLLVQANLASWRGERDESERLLKAVLASAPESGDAWRLLGEILFHYNMIRGRSRLEAWEALQRAEALDAAEETIYHLIEMALWKGDAAAARSYFARLDMERVDLKWRGLHSVGVGDVEDRRRLMADARRADNRKLYQLVEAIARLAPEDRSALQLAGYLTEPSRPPDWQAIGHWVTGLVELAGGRWESAARAFRVAQELEPAWALEQRALYAALPFFPIAREELVGIRDAVLRWDAADHPSLNRLPAVHDDLHPYLRLYLLGLLSSRLDEPDMALRQAVELERMGGDSMQTRQARRLAGTIRAHLAWTAGRPGETLSLLSERELPVQSGEMISPILAGYFERYLRAEALRDVGRGREAFRWYASVGDYVLYGLPYRAMTHLRRAEILQAAGETSAAATHCAQFLRLWRRADAALLSAIRAVEEPVCGPSSLQRTARNPRISPPSASSLEL